MSKTDISTVIDFLMLARDRYKTDYIQLKKTYEKKMKEIQKDFKPDTERFNMEMQKAKQHFEKQVEEQRQSVKEFALRNVDEILADEVDTVRKIDTVAMEKLSAVSSLPLTATEISILKERFAPEGEYWPSRMISDLAEKNGLNPTQFIHSATLDVKLNVLQELRQHLETFLTNYDGSFNYKTEVLLDDTVLLRAQSIYMNGYANETMENERTARVSLMRLKGKNAFEKGIGLANILNNTTESIKRALFYEIANNVNGVNIDAVALRWAGYDAEFEAYKKNEHSDYKEAKKAFNKVVTAESEEEVEGVAVRMGENKYFNDMLQTSKITNKHIESYLHNIGTKASTKTAE